MTNRMRDLGEFIREQRRQAQLSLRKLSEQAGISNPYLSQIERGLRKPSAEILQAIAKALRISAETLYVRAGILDAESSDSDVVSAILRDKSITEGQKQTLIEVYHSLRLVNSRSFRERFEGAGSRDAIDLESEKSQAISDDGLSGDKPSAGFYSVEGERGESIARKGLDEGIATDGEAPTQGDREVAV
ncbi:MAG: transcriptional regulator [Acidimicrobiia bacterium]